MGNVSFAGFREYLEASSRDKDKDRGKDGKNVPMDYLGALQFQLNVKKPSTLRNIYATEPQIVSGLPWDNVSSLDDKDGKTLDSLDATYLPIIAKPGLKSGSYATIPNVSQTLATKKGRMLDKEKYKRKGVTDRDNLQQFLGIGWSPALAAAAGGAAPPTG